MEKVNFGRPNCFEFALEFLGEPEATELRRYIESLEVKVLIYEAKGQQKMQSRLDTCRGKLYQRTKERDNVQTKYNVLLYTIGNSSVQGMQPLLALYNELTKK